VGGGAGGIGRATAEHLLRAGYHVVLTGRRGETLETAASELTEETGQTTHWLVSDITQPGSAEETISTVENRYGSLDALVVNAGGPPPGNILEVEDEQWYSAFELVLLGPLRLARLALPAMAERGFGRVVFVTSSAVRQPQPDLAPSVVLRSAATAAAKLLSRQYAAEGVTVNCIAPGPTATARRTEILTARTHATGRDFAELDAEDTAAVPAGRSAAPAEIGAAIAFLASPEAGYVNGTVLTVDGGRTETI
jgi:3-oxoacyl-[acyl-carrier protein] reductase